MPPRFRGATSRRPPPRLSAVWHARALLRLRWAQCRALLRNRYDSAALVLGAAAVVAVATADLVYQWTGRLPPGCDRAFFQGVGVPHGCEPAHYVSVSLSTTCFCLTTACLFWAQAQRIVFIHTRLRRRRGRQVASRCDDTGAGTPVEDLPVRQQRTPLYSSSGGMPEPLSGIRLWGSGSAGWAVASSRQSWLEATGAVYSTMVFLLTVTLGVTSVLAALNVVTALTWAEWTRGASWEYACATCSDETMQGGGREAVVARCVGNGVAPLNMCFLAWHARGIFPHLVAGQVVSLGLVSGLTPLRVWDPIAVEAGKQTGLRWLDLLHVLYIMLAPSSLHVTLPLVALSAMEFHWGPRLLLEVSGCASIIFGLAQPCLAAWMLWIGHRHQPQDGSVPRQGGGSIWHRVRRLPSAIVSALFYESAASLNIKLMYLLVLIMFIFSIHIGVFGPANYAVVLALRAGILVVFLLSRDQPSSFRELRHDPQGAGFGLVVDACHLQQALHGFLRDAARPQALPTYKATVYRMEATMAVSYRWQGVEALVCPGLSLNMSRWQMEQLMRALETTSCFYVWIDRLSVPQDESQLQNTLLSRMMATFASARETLVLRARESGGSRYHERAWTLSEFVCSASPMICTEDSEVEAAKTPQAWSTDGQLSHTKAEEALVVEIREHYLAHLPECRPLWLHPNQSPQLSPDFERTWELYERVLGLLQCSVAEDRIRAVYPLLCNVPVDTHEELVVLVDAVASALEARAPQSAASQLARRHYHAIVGVEVIDVDEIPEAVLKIQV
eukprot:jgi/Tetstr1/436364/TSEL_025197.t1